LGALTVQLGGFMTIDTIHAGLAEMNIRLNALIFAHIFVANPAAVAGGAGASHGWRAFEEVSIE
jgi:hypothetical protein